MVVCVALIIGEMYPERKSRQHVTTASCVGW